MRRLTVFVGIAAFLLSVSATLFRGRLFNAGHAEYESLARVWAGLSSKDVRDMQLLPHIRHRVQGARTLASGIDVMEPPVRQHILSELVVSGTMAQGRALNRQPLRWECLLRVTTAADTLFCHLDVRKDGDNESVICTLVTPTGNGGEYDYAPTRRPGYGWSRSLASVLESVRKDGDVELRAAM